MNNRTLSLVLIATVCATLISCSRSAAPTAATTPEVTTVTVTPQRVVLTTELPGRTSPYRIAEIRPQVNGLIQKRLFTEGADVNEGQALYQIDPAPFEAALANAEAALGRAQASLPAIQSRVDRFKEALADKAVSQQDFDDADAALKQALADVEYWKAMVATARINLGYARVESPISGRIGTSAVTDGAIVTAYQMTPLTTVQQLDPIYVNVPQSTAELLRLRRRLEDGQIGSAGTNHNRVQLVLEDGSTFPMEGTLQFRDVTVEPTTASVILRMVFPNPDGVLLPGMFVRTQVKDGVVEQGILIPQQAVLRDPKGNPYALVLDANSTAQARPLVLDRAIGNEWLITSGLAEGDRLVVEGFQRVRPGMPVKEAQPGADKTGAPAPTGAAQTEPTSN